MSSAPFNHNQQRKYLAVRNVWIVLLYARLNGTILWIYECLQYHTLSLHTPYTILSIYAGRRTLLKSLPPLQGVCVRVCVCIPGRIKNYKRGIQHARLISHCTQLSHVCVYVCSRAIKNYVRSRIVCAFAFTAHCRPLIVNVNTCYVNVHKSRGLFFILFSVYIGLQYVYTGSIQTGV